MSKPTPIPPSSALVIHKRRRCRDWPATPTFTSRRQLHVPIYSHLMPLHGILSSRGCLFEGAPYAGRASRTTRLKSRPWPPCPPPRPTPCPGDMGNTAFPEIGDSDHWDRQAGAHGSGPGHIRPGGNKTVAPDAQARTRGLLKVAMVCWISPGIPLSIGTVAEILGAFACELHQEYAAHDQQAGRERNDQAKRRRLRNRCYRDTVHLQVFCA